MQLTWLEMEDFLRAAGPFVLVIAGLGMVLLAVAVERLLYLHGDYRRDRHRLLTAWLVGVSMPRRLRYRQRRLLLGQARKRLGRYRGLLSAGITLCPLLGLLGSVTGMMAVFQAMAAENQVDRSLLAQQMTLICLPTLAGLVVALSALLFKSYLDGRCSQHLSHFSRSLGWDGVSNHC